MTKQRLFGSAVGSLAAIAVSILVAPLFAGAHEGHVHATTDGSSSTSSAKEDMIVSSTDTPLQRQAKLQRMWTVYREQDSTKLWAISPLEGSSACMAVGCPEPTELTFEKREIQTLAFFSAFNANYFIRLAEGKWLSELSEGAPITSIDGLEFTDFVKRPIGCRLVKSAAHPAVYLACHGKRRAVIREGVFHQFGWEFRDVETVSDSEIAAYEEETPVTEETVFEEDIEVETTENRELTEQVTKRLELRGKNMTRDRLIKSPGDPRVYLLDKNGERRHVHDLAAVRRHGLNLKDVTEISQDELEAIPEGEMVTETTSQGELAE